MPTAPLPAALQPSQDAILTELKDGTGVLLDLHSRFYFTLNRTGVAAWKLLAAGEATTLPALAAALAAAFRDAPPEAVARDLEALLVELRDEGLLLGPPPRTGQSG